MVNNFVNTPIVYQFGIRYPRMWCEQWQQHGTKIDLKAHIDLHSLTEAGPSSTKITDRRTRETSARCPVFRVIYNLLSNPQFDQ